MTLKEFRTDRGMSQVVLAQKLGISSQLVSFFETDRQKPSLRVKQEFKRQFSGYNVPMMEYTEDELKEITKPQRGPVTGLNYKSVNAPAKPGKVEPRLNERLPVSVEIDGKEVKRVDEKALKEKLDVGEEMVVRQGDKKELNELVEELKPTKPLTKTIHILRRDGDREVRSEE